MSVNHLWWRTFAAERAYTESGASLDPGQRVPHGSEEPMVRREVVAADPPLTRLLPAIMFNVAGAITPLPLPVNGWGRLMRAWTSKGSPGGPRPCAAALAAVATD
jgi:hypothetical protein